MQLPISQKPRTRTQAPAGTRTRTRIGATPRTSSIKIPASSLRTRSLPCTDQLVRPQFLRVQSGLPWWAVDLHLRLLSPSQRAGSRKTDPDIVRNSVDLTVTQMNLDRAGISMRLKIAINNEMMSRSIVLRKVKFDVRLASR